MEEGERDKRDLHVRAERKPVLFPQMVKQKAKRVGLGRLRKIWNRINSERKGPEPDSDLGNRNGQALRGGKDKKGRRKGRYLLSRVSTRTVKREKPRQNTDGERDGGEGQAERERRRRTRLEEGRRFCFRLSVSAAVAVPCFSRPTDNRFAVLYSPL